MNFCNGRTKFKFEFNGHFRHFRGLNLLSYEKCSKWESNLQILRLTFLNKQRLTEFLFKILIYTYHRGLTKKEIIFLGNPRLRIREI